MLSNTFYNVMKTIGIAGGGQLGRMLTEAAHALGDKVVILDPTHNAPASHIADQHIVADFKDAKSMEELASHCDVITFEIESANASALETLGKRGFPVHPTPKTLSIIKDKWVQKTFLVEHGIPVAPFCLVEEAEKQLGYPCIVKARSGGYDGRGNALVRSEKEMQEAKEKLGERVYAEGLVHFEKELAIVAARTSTGEIVVYPLVETIHKNHICHEVLAPAPVSDVIAKKAHDLAERVLSAFDGAGVFAIEMFLADGEVLVNEVAPRVHNSGHFTIEACETSQFENHIRAVTGVKLGSSALKVGAAVMINILGERSGPADPRGITEAETVPGVSVHIYGKMETRPERKMGHLTAVAHTLEEARKNANRARTYISI